MEIVADHQDRGPRVGAHLFDQAVEGGLTGLVKSLRRLVKDKDLRPGQQGARESTRCICPPDRGGHLRLADVGKADTGQHRRRRGSLTRVGRDRKRRTVIGRCGPASGAAAHSRCAAGCARDRPGGDRDNPQKRPEERGFP